MCNINSTIRVNKVLIIELQNENLHPVAIRWALNNNVLKSEIFPLQIETLDSMCLIIELHN